MKISRLYILAAISAAAFGAHSQTIAEEITDTLLIVEKPSRLVITENHDGATIHVAGLDSVNTFQTSIKTEFPENSSVSSKQSVLKESLIQLPGLKSDKKGWYCSVDGVTIGLTEASGSGDDGGLQWSKSFEIGWLSCLAGGYSWGNTSLTLGLGFDWRNYKITTSDRYLTPTPDKGITWTPAGTLPEGSHLLNSRLLVFSLQLPLLFRADIPKTNLKVRLGPIFNFNTYASLKTNFIDADGNRADIFTKEINPRRFTLDLFGIVSFKFIGVYVRCSPLKVMDAIDGINFKPLTIGVGIGI